MNALINKFTTLLNSTNRKGIDGLLTYLKTQTDFYTAPASSSGHGMYEGGLLEHSLEVYDNLLVINNAFKIKCEPDTAIISSLLHDLCKTNFYKLDKKDRKVKDENGNDVLNSYGKPTWLPEVYYSFDDKLPLGHGEKSIIIAQQHIPLTVEEIMSIRWHMGGFDDTGRSYSGGFALSRAMDKYPLVTALQIADLAATRFEKLT